MKISSFTVIVIFTALSIVGCALVPLLPVKLSPSGALPSLTVSFSMPNASPRAVESEVTSRIEGVLARVGSVKNIESSSSNGRGQVTINLDRHADLDKIRLEVSTLIRQLWADMPYETSYPSISLKQAESDNARPFMTLSLNAPASPSDIQQYGEDKLKPMLSNIPGVYNVTLTGAPPMEWQILYDIDRLSSVGVSPDDIIKAIKEHNNSEFLGIAHTGTVESQNCIRLAMHPQRTDGVFSPNEIVVRTTGGNSITLDKLVTVTHREASPSGYFRINGNNSIYVNITSGETANQLEVAAAVRSAVDTFIQTAPNEYAVETVYDATEEIGGELNKIYFRTALTVLILLLFVGLVSLSLRYVLLVSIGLSVNIAIAVVFYYLTGVEIQLYSLAGITISLNLIIDNLIVMTDHYTRCHDRKVFTSILAATLTTMGTLSVVYFMDERTRLSLQDFVTVVIINLSVSLAVALFLVPALVDRLGVRKKKAPGGLRVWRIRLSLFLTHVYERIVVIVVRFRVAFIIVAILSFGLPVFMLPEKIDGESTFAKKYNEIFGSYTYVEKIKPWVDRTLGGTLRLFVENVYDGEYWGREPGEPVLYIVASLPNGATLSQMDGLIKKMESILGTYPQIRQFQTNISGPRSARIAIFFEKESQRDGFPYRLKQEIISKALTLGGGSWAVYGLEDQGFSNDVRETAGSTRVRITGYNYDELSDWAYRLRDSLLTHRRIQDVTIGYEFSYTKDDYSEFYLSIDRRRLTENNLSASELYNAVAPTFGRDMSAGSIISGNQVENVRLHSAQADRYDLYTLMNQPFSSSDKVFKLSDLGSIEKRQAPQKIVKKNQEYVLCLQYEYIGTDKQGKKVLTQELEKINSILPAGYRAFEGDGHQSGKKDEPSRYWLLLLVACIIFFTTSILFNSLQRPFVIILMIPLSFIGVFLAFYLPGLKFDQGGFASFILLAGITVNAAIYLLNEYDSLCRQHPCVNPLRLYMRAFRLKIVPIMLTVLSTILGFIPFIIGETRESFWYPLAIGTMGGLVMSIAALFFIFPIFVLPQESVMKKYLPNY